MARERGFIVEVAEFEKLMEEQRDRARKAQKKEEISVDEGEFGVEPTKFLGYDFLETESVVETVLPGKQPSEVNVVLIVPRFTPKWAAKSAIADCFTFRDAIGQRSVSCA